MNERYIRRHRLPFEDDEGTYAVLDLKTGRDVTKGFPAEFAQYLADKFEDGNVTVLRRFHVDHQFDDIADALTPGGEG